MLTDEQIRDIAIRHNDNRHGIVGKFEIRYTSLVDIETAIKEALALQSLGGWQPIETAPKDGDLLVVTVTGNVVISDAAYVHRLIRVSKQDDDRCYYTLWQPLPPLPSPPEGEHD